MTVTDFRFERTITLGNVLSAGTALAAIMAAYFTLVMRIDIQVERGSLMDRRISTVESAMSELSKAIVADRLANNALLVQVQTDIGYMKSGIEEVKQLVK